MLSASDIRGLMAMMPAFATDDAGHIMARDTVSVPRLRDGLDRMVRDGANVISTTGSFGECHTLLQDEFRVLAHETADVVNRRVPLFLGVTAPNAREAVDRIKIVQETRADGILVGIPYYFPSTQANALRFLRDIAENFPKLNIILYHNPKLHNVTLTLELFPELVKIPQIVGIKDSHRDILTMMKLNEIVRGKISVLVNQYQYAALSEIGASGFWSIDAWMGPWPLFALRDAVSRGDLKAARALTFELAPPGTTKIDFSWRETSSKIATRYAGYVDPGPLRPPFLEVPPEVDAGARRKADRWQAICNRMAAANAAE